MNGLSSSHPRLAVIPWIKQLCHAQPSFIEIDKSFIEDSFNLFGLKQIINDFNNALNIILDKKCLSFSFTSSSSSYSSFLSF